MIRLCDETVKRLGVYLQHGRVLGVEACLGERKGSETRREGGEEGLLMHGRG